MDRNILINSKRQQKIKLKLTEKKNMEKENTTDESDCSENEIPGLVSLKPFEFERKTNIGDMNSSQTHSTQVFYKKAILKNFVTFTGKRLCWSLF